MLPFDSIHIHSLEPSLDQTVSPDEFIQIPLQLRIKCILEKRLDFLDHGEVVNSREALKALRQYMATH